MIANSPACGVDAFAKRTPRLKQNNHLFQRNKIAPGKIEIQAKLRLCRQKHGTLR